jgi:hypothetical protein
MRLKYKKGIGAITESDVLSEKITINVPLFDPLNCPERSEGNLGVKKVEAPSKCPKKWLKKLLSQKKTLCPKVS